MKTELYKVFAIKHDVKNEETVREEADEDYVAKCVGSFGIWQAGICVAATLTRFIAMWNIFSIIFLTPPTDYLCVEFKDNTTVEVENSTCYDNCVKYEFQSVVFERTLIEDFGLICEHAWLGSFTQMVLMFGTLVGVSFFGWISDRFGRRIALLLAVYSNIIFMFMIPFSPYFWIFCCLRFIIGVCSGGIMVISVIIVFEVVGSKHREAAGCCGVLPDGLSEVFLSLFAYFSPTWKVYLLAYSAVSILIAIGIIVVPETVRWLIVNGREDEAVELLTKAAKRNKRSIANIRENVTTIVNDLNAKKAVKANYFDLFRPSLALNTVSSFILWTIVGIVYFGMSQYVTFLGQNIFIAAAISGFIQVPADPLSMVLNKTIGRKMSTIFSLLATGLFLITLTLLPKAHWISSLFGILGICSISTTFAVVYVYAAELFPTPVRNMAFGVCSAGAKMGAMIAPFIVNLSPNWVPSLMFAILPFGGAAVGLLLPETKGTNLKDTVT